MELTVNEDKEELYKAVINIITKSIKELLIKQKRVVLSIPGGRNVPRIFQLLKEADIPWKKVHIFMVDERLVALDDEESNFRLAKENFIDELVAKGTLPEANVHPFIMDKNKPYFGIYDYEQELKKYGGVYDIILLSAGEDCHVGALYPNHHSIEDNAEYFLAMNDSPKLPKERMTLSRKQLLKSKVAVLLFIGEAKRKAYEKFLNNAIDYNVCPAKLILSAKNAYVITNLKKGE